MRYCAKSDTFEFKGRVYDVEFGSDDTRHGGPFDRGSADSYYGRGYRPHYYVGDTGLSEVVAELTDVEKEAYYAGYEYNEEIVRDFKDWG